MTPDINESGLPDRLIQAAAAIEELSMALGNTKECAYTPQSLRLQSKRLRIIDDDL